MQELMVQKHNFAKELKQLKDLSKNIPTDCTLPEVEVDGGFLGLGNHKVTGEEFNKQTKLLQERLISINQTHRNFFKEFETIYKTFDTLDKEYIAGIVATIDNTQKAQQDIKDTIEALKKTILLLKEFKAEVSNQIVEINAGYNSIRTFLDKCKYINDLSEIQDEINRCRDKQTLMGKHINNLEIENNKLHQQHTDDLEQIHKDINMHRDTLTFISEQLNNYESKNSKLHQQHADDINALNLNTRKQIKIAYWLSGSCVVLLMLNLALQIIGIL